jgi:hypothetical protein
MRETAAHDSETEAGLVAVTGDGVIFRGPDDSDIVP